MGMGREGLEGEGSRHIPLTTVNRATRLSATVPLDACTGSQRRPARLGWSVGRTARRVIRRRGVKSGSHGLTWGGVKSEQWNFTRRTAGRMRHEATTHRLQTGGRRGKGGRSATPHKTHTLPPNVVNGEGEEIRGRMKGGWGFVWGKRQSRGGGMMVGATWARLDPGIVVDLSPSGSDWQITQSMDILGLSSQTVECEVGLLRRDRVLGSCRSPVLGMFGSDLYLRETGPLLLSTEGVDKKKCSKKKKQKARNQILYHRK